MNWIIWAAMWIVCVMVIMTFFKGAGELKKK